MERVNLPCMAEESLEAFKMITTDPGGGGGAE